MVDEKKYEAAFQMILNAGNSKSFSLMAIEAAREGNFEEAEEKLKEAAKEMHAAHNVQFDMVQQEAAGNPAEVNIILIHSMDHLTMATLTMDLAETLIAMCQEINTLKNK